MRDADSTTVRLSEYRPPDYAIDDIALVFALDPEETLVAATSSVRRVSAAPAPLILNGARLELQSIAIDGRLLAQGEYKLSADALVIADPPASFRLDIVTRLNPAANTHLEGLYMSGGRFCTQCEAEGFRSITYSLDRPDVLSRYAVRIEADKTAFPTLLANGNPTESGDLADGKHYAVWIDPYPKPSYLFALVAGSFDAVGDAFTTMSGRKVAVTIFVDPGDGERAHYAMDALKRAMAWDERAFLREYDLDVFNIVAVRDFNFGAMENKGLNIFNSSLILADAQTATDADFEAIEAVVGHEYFHNWTGNRITCRDWFQLCLKEGLTVYREQEFCADQRSPAVQRIKDVKRLRGRQFAEDAGPLAHPVRPQHYQKIDNFYTATVYEKGGEVIRMLKRVVGADAFDKGMQLYFSRRDGAAATVEDLIACFEETSGQNLSHFMLWYDQAGTPHLHAATAYDSTAKTLELSIEQKIAPTPEQPSKAPALIPLQIGLIASDGAILASKLSGDSIARTQHGVILAQARHTFRFEGVLERPIPALLRQFSAPVVLHDSVSDDDRLAQMAHDPDSFTRWEAGQSIARKILLGQSDGLADKLAEAYARELDRAPQDHGFAALALRVPDLGELILASDHPDPETLFAARERLRAYLASALERQLVPLATLPNDTEFSPSASAAGKRALKSAALDLLAARGEHHVEILDRAFRTANDMTTRMAALEALGASGAAAFDEALGDFYERWRDIPLVVDKWFAVQAAAARDDASARVGALRAHAAFTLRNPNRVRALVAVFAMRNARAFHAADGAGYRFVAEAVADTDPLNPALAGRLLTPFETWRRFDPARQTQARAALEALAARDLSANAREMVERTLA